MSVTKPEASTLLETTVVVVRREDGRILWTRRVDDGTWEVPGGVLESGETPQRGARREIKEETGLELGAVWLLGVLEFFSHRRQRRGRCNVLEAVALSDRVVPQPEEISDWAWLPPGIKKGPTVPLVERSVQLASLRPDSLVREEVSE